MTTSDVTTGSNNWTRMFSEGFSDDNHRLYVTIGCQQSYECFLKGFQMTTSDCMWQLAANNCKNVFWRAAHLCLLKAGSCYCAFVCSTIVYVYKCTWLLCKTREILELSFKIPVFWAFPLTVDCKVYCKVLPLLHCFYLAHFILMWLQHSYTLRKSNG